MIELSNYPFSHCHKGLGPGDLHGDSFLSQLDVAVDRFRAEISFGSQQPPDLG